MADGKLYRLITVGLWVGLVAEVLFVTGVVFESGFDQLPKRILRALLFAEREPVVIVLFWIYPLMLGVQYVIEGEAKWLPWKR